MSFRLSERRKSDLAVEKLPKTENSINGTKNEHSRSLGLEATKKSQNNERNTTIQNNKLRIDFQNNVNKSSKNSSLKYSHMEYS